MRQRRADSRSEIQERMFAYEKNERSLLERIGSFALAVVLILGLLPVQALADDSRRAVQVGMII